MGNWVSYQRSKKKTGTLSKDRIQRLEALPGWEWNRFDAAWEKTYALLRDISHIAYSESRPGFSAHPDCLCEISEQRPSHLLQQDFPVPQEVLRPATGSKRRVVAKQAASKAHRAASAGVETH